METETTEINTTKTEILHSLLSLYEKGVSLRSESIQKAAPHLYFQLYSDEQRIERPYASLKDAREDLALQLNEQGRKKDARAILNYNKRVSPNKFSDDKIELVKNELITILQEKEKNGEDLRYRSQQSINRSFAGKGYRYFNGWDKFLNAANIDPQEVARQTKFPIEMYFCTLYDWFLQGNAMDMTSVQETLPQLVGALNQRCSGYYKALSKMEKLLTKSGLIDEAEEFSPQQWKNNSRRLQAQLTLEQKEKALEKILSFDVRKSYERQIAEKLGVGVSTDYVLGRDIKDFLASSKKWLTPERTALRAGISGPGVLKQIPNISDKVVQIIEKGKPRYYISIDAIAEITNKMPTQNKYMTLTDIARKCNVEYNVVRRHRIELNLGKKTKTGRIQHRLTKKEQKMLEKGIRCEQEIEFERTRTWIAKIKTRQTWTPTELAREKIPATHFYQLAKRKHLQPQALILPREIVTRYFLERSGLDDERAA